MTALKDVNSKNYKAMKKFKKYTRIIFLIQFVLIPFFAVSQQHKKSTPPKKNICTTYVYNLNTDEMRIRDICFDILKTDHIDMNQFNSGQKWDKKNDFWKFQITIKDNEKLKETTLKASFYIYEESSEIIQYHCIVESASIKAIIYDKTKKSWQILVLQNDNYKMLSSYTGYHFTNAFDIKHKTPVEDEY